MLVHDLLRRAVDGDSARPAVVAPSGVTSYGAIAEEAARVADVLVAAGVRRGDRVVFALENSPLWVSCFFGILQAGAVAVPLPAGQKHDRLQYALHDCSPAACVVDGSAAVALAGVFPKTCTVFTVGRSEDDGASDGVCLRTAMRAAAPSGRRVRVIDVDLAAIIYTSGSTGRPRGVMLSHLNFTANAASIVEYLHLSGSDRVMVVLPFHYVYGLSLLTTHVAVGGSLALDNRFAFPNAILATMQQFEVTGFAGVPSTFAWLLHKSSIRRMTFPSLRYITQAGGPMPPALLQRWLALMPSVPFFVMYGATEACARLAYLDPKELPARIGSIGKAIPNVELRVIRDDGEPAAPGEIGEIVARGANIMIGYWNAPEETRAALGPRGYRTGDLARADADGNLYIVGRRQDMLKVGGERVSAKEIEDVLHEHPAVLEAAVVGAPHELLGEVPVAFVVFAPGGSPDAGELIAMCRTRLAEQRVPTRVLVRDDLPKSSAGKIDKAALRGLLDSVAVS